MVPRYHSAQDHRLARAMELGRCLDRPRMTWWQHAELTLALRRSAGCTLLPVHEAMLMSICRRGDRTLFPTLTLRRPLSASSEASSNLKTPLHMGSNLQERLERAVNHMTHAGFRYRFAMLLISAHSTLSHHRLCMAA